MKNISFGETEFIKNSIEFYGSTADIETVVNPSIVINNCEKNNCQKNNCKAYQSKNKFLGLYDYFGIPRYFRNNKYHSCNKNNCNKNNCSCNKNNSNYDKNNSNYDKNKSNNINYSDNSNSNTNTNKLITYISTLITILLILSFILIKSSDEFNKTIKFFIVIGIISCIILITLPFI